MVQTARDTQNVSELYLLSVLLISLSTSGYFWGLLGAAAEWSAPTICLLIPIMRLIFSLKGYPVTFLCMLLVAGISSTLAAGIKEQRNLSQSREENTQKLNRVASNCWAPKQPNKSARWRRGVFQNFAVASLLLSDG